MENVGVLQGTYSPAVQRGAFCPSEGAICPDNAEVDGSIPSSPTQTRRSEAVSAGSFRRFERSIAGHDWARRGTCGARLEVRPDRGG